MANRAEVVTVAIVSIIRTQVQRGKAADYAAMRAEIEAVLGDEFDAAARQARDDLKSPE